MKKVVLISSHFFAHLRRPVGYVCDLLIGENHKMIPRMVVGVLFIVIGVNIAELKEHFENTVIQGCCDGTGYAIHAFGVSPFLDYIKILKDKFYE